MFLDLIKIFVPTTLAFFLGLTLTPIATHFFYKYKMWKRYSRSGNDAAVDFQKIHNEEQELKTPRVGGIIIWISVLLVIALFYFISVLFPSLGTEKMNFLSRNQTLIPFFTLILGSILGLWDDLIQIYGKGSFARDDKSWRKWKAFLVSFIALLIGCWFFYKLGMTSIHVPFGGDLTLGILIIPFFIIVALATFSGVLTGATLAFLWFNIPPARFYMGETGMIGLTVTLATLAFLTDTVLILPVIAMPLVVTTLSDIIQMTSRARRGKKVFKLAPLHHHFEANGWSSAKVTMRYWIFGVIFAIIGVILAVTS